MSRDRTTLTIDRNRLVRRLCRENGLIDAHTHLGADPAAYYGGSHPYAISAEDHGLRMAQSGIAASLCFPWTFTNYFALTPFLHGRFRRNPGGGSPHPFAFENERNCREIYEAFPEYAGRLLPFAFFDPLRRPREQAEGIRALAARYPLFGLKTATSYLQSPITELLRKGACLLDLAADLNLPVTVHCAVLPGDPWANVFDILKVIRARTDVRFAIAHTCRFDRRALDAAAALPNAFVDFSAFHIHCELARQNHPAVAARADRFRADYRNHSAAMQRIAETYPETMLWGSDTPAHLWKSRFRDDTGRDIMIDLPCAPTREVDELHKLPYTLQRHIARTTTLRFLFGAAQRDRSQGGQHE